MFNTNLSSKSAHSQHVFISNIIYIQFIYNLHLKKIVTTSSLYYSCHLLAKICLTAVSKTDLISHQQKVPG